MDVSHLIKQINDAYYFLYYESKSQIMMKREEQLSLRKLLGDNHCIEESIGFIEGDKITSGVLDKKAV